MERIILAEIFKCGVRDVDVFVNIFQKCYENELFFSFEEIEMNYGWIITIDYCISEGLYLLAEWFFKQYEGKIENILNIQDFNRYREENDIYEVHANWNASEITFYNDKIDSLFVNSEFYFK